MHHLTSAKFQYITSCIDIQVNVVRTYMYYSRQVLPLDRNDNFTRDYTPAGNEIGKHLNTLVASPMSLMASLVTTSWRQQCFNVLIDSYHGFLLLFYCCVLVEIKLTTTHVVALSSEHWPCNIYGTIQMDYRIGWRWCYWLSPVYVVDGQLHVL